MNFIDGMRFRGHTALSIPSHGSATSGQHKYSVLAFVGYSVVATCSEVRGRGVVLSQQGDPSLPARCLMLLGGFQPFSPTRSAQLGSTALAGACRLT